MKSRNIINNRKNIICASIIFIFILSACLPASRTPRTSAPITSVGEGMFHEVKTPALMSKKMAPSSIAVSKSGFIVPPLVATPGKNTLGISQSDKIGPNFVYKDRKAKELRESFSFVFVKKLSYLEYLKHDINIIEEIISSSPISVKHFRALNALKEAYLFYTKKNKLYPDIVKKITEKKHVSSKQSDFAQLVNRIYFIMRDTFINRRIDYRLRSNALRYMEEMRGEVIVDFFVEDALDEIASSKNAPPLLVAKAKSILDKHQ